MNYYISDLHLGHANVIKYDNRPFSSVEEMNSVIMKNWNERVKEEDTVYILGDVAFGKENEWPSYLGTLRGKKVLVRGNHDPRSLSETTRSLFSLVVNYTELIDNDRLVILCHYPIPFFKNDFSPNSYMLYGHVHETIEYEYVKALRKQIIDKAFGDSSPSGNFINIGAMMPYMNYTPRTLDEIIAGDLEYRK